MAQVTCAICNKKQTIAAMELSIAPNADSGFVMTMQALEKLSTRNANLTVSNR